MVFDVESVGLHGEGFAVGYVIIEEDGLEIESGFFRSPIETAIGQLDGFRWCDSNVEPVINKHVPSTFADMGCCQGTKDVRDYFWRTWLKWKTQGALLAADCVWPVEARFISACIDDDLLLRKFMGPYPVIDISSVLLAAGFDPIGSFYRKENEKTKHHPLADARQSARLLVEALKEINSRKSSL